ncbi:MAG: hypothetical protein AB7R89_13775 [Dehalococcoidia bacterium]
MTEPAEFPLGTRVRIAGVPDDDPTLRHVIGYTGTICRVGVGPAPRTLTVCFDPDPSKPDSSGFWTFAPHHLVTLDGSAAAQQEAMF